MLSFNFEFENDWQMIGGKLLTWQSDELAQLAHIRQLDYIDQIERAALIENVVDNIFHIALKLRKRLTNEG